MNAEGKTMRIRFTLLMCATAAMTAMAGPATHFPNDVYFHGGTYFVAGGTNAAWTNIPSVSVVVAGATNFANVHSNNVYDTGTTQTLARLKVTAGADFSGGTLFSISGVSESPTGVVHHMVLVDTNGVVVDPTNLAAANGWLTNAGAFVSSSGGTYYNGTYSFRSASLTNWDVGDYGTAPGLFEISSGGYTVTDALVVAGAKFQVWPAFTRSFEDESGVHTVIDSGSTRIYGGKIGGGGSTNRASIYVGDGYSTIGLETNIGVRGGITISGDYLRFNGADVVTTSGGLSGLWTNLVENVTIIGRFSQGTNCTASGIWSHSQGYGSEATGAYAHAEGRTTHAFGMASHAEGWNACASGMRSHAEGNATVASGEASHAEGSESTASGYASHAGGEYATASHDNSWVWGDGVDVESTDEKQFTVHASNGTRLLGGGLTVEGGISGSGTGLTDIPVSAISGGWSGSWTSVVQNVTNVLQFHNGIATNRMTL